MEQIIFHLGSALITPSRILFTSTENDLRKALTYTARSGNGVAVPAFHAHFIAFFGIHHIICGFDEWEAVLIGIYIERDSKRVNIYCVRRHIRERLLSYEFRRHVVIGATK